jgi:UDPglucose 6-dehydrogenase
MIYVDDMYAAARGTDAVVLMTEWNQYRAMDFAKIRSPMWGGIFIDLRNVFERQQMEQNRFDHFCVGR